MSRRLFLQSSLALAGSASPTGALLANLSGATVGINAASSDKQSEEVRNVEPLELAIGGGLVRLFRGTPFCHIMVEIPRMRQAFAEEGIAMPLVRIRDWLTLGKLNYAIDVYGVRMAEASCGMLRNVTNDDANYATRRRIAEDQILNHLRTIVREGAYYQALK
ncbi:flagellar biosynthesis protein FlhA [Anatilimnocola aggregata]|uniref:Flagellar biosynthesis protein FlhA n=2 Tax=Anatilimnocola aggregata TaxID=2528021 RepID=A0A517YDM6_9BACT|nr:flagellar biosynthesis protein FlhA [Anatilimnocola aggregata]